jgi:hypothetical protein
MCSYDLLLHRAPPDRPHAMLFSAPTLEEAAAAVAAQSNADELAVYFHFHGASRDLNPEEQSQLTHLLD